VNQTPFGTATPPQSNTPTFGQPAQQQQNTPFVFGGTPGGGGGFGNPRMAPAATFPFGGGADSPMAFGQQQPQQQMQQMQQMQQQQQAFGGGGAAVFNMGASDNDRKVKTAVRKRK